MIVNGWYTHISIQHALNFFDQHSSCPEKKLEGFVKEIKTKLKSPYGLNANQQRLETPLNLGGFHLINLQKQLHGRKAFYIYELLTNNETPSVINFRFIIQMAVLEVTNHLCHYLGNMNDNNNSNRRITMLWSDFIPHHDFQGHVNEPIINSATIQRQTISTLENKYPQLADYLASWFKTTKTDPVVATSTIGTNISVAISHSDNNIIYTPPPNEKLRSILATTTNQIITAEAFRQPKPKVTLSSFWKQVSIYQHKYLGYLESLHFFQIGNLHHLLNTHNTQKCWLCLEHSSHETIDHLLERDPISKQIWNIVASSSSYVENTILYQQQIHMKDLDSPDDDLSTLLKYSSYI
ncbi:unnamed protein product [Ambrosiozyma monospora]|uniref:Unnamed protein product n=1 Tax=Ambrosiozyma monospora TaxID=43982 RepID=A0ACB5SVS5_AMBMO|nr:unnamed protein product [Ambrosiozyma monospora]